MINLNLAQLNRQTKLRWQVVRLVLAVGGLGFCYAVETALVSPLLLKLGIPRQYMTLVWCISPVLGLLFGHAFYSLKFEGIFGFGKHRALILFLSLGIIVGLLLIMSGDILGLSMIKQHDGKHYQQEAKTTTYYGTNTFNNTRNWTAEEVNLPKERSTSPIAIFLAILGVSLLDFCCYACQNPIKAYLLEVTTSDLHKTSLKTFTLLAGVGGVLGFLCAGVDWTSSFIGNNSNGQVVVTVVISIIIFVLCVILTLTSKNANQLNQTNEENEMRFHFQNLGTHLSPSDEDVSVGTSYYDLSDDRDSWYSAVSRQQEGEFSTSSESQISETGQLNLQSMMLYVKHIPKSLLILWVTHLCCWMSYLAYVLYFTDFVGQAVFQGDPHANEAEPKALTLYNRGVRFGSIHMSLTPLTGTVCCLLMERVILKIGARATYIIFQLVYTCGALIMVVSLHQVAVSIVSVTAGFMYALLHTMPFTMTVLYHCKQQFASDEVKALNQNREYTRDLSTDIYVLTTIVFVAQFLLSAIMGPLVYLTGSTRTVMTCAAVLSACGAASATRVMYLDIQ